MKRIALVLVALLLTINLFAIASWPTDSWPVASWPTTFSNTHNLSNENATNDDEWILVGEVVLTYFKDYEDTLKANLYIREVAHKIIYRIEYNGKFYAIRKFYQEDDRDTRYLVTIEDKSYFFHVQ